MRSGTLNSGALRMKERLRVRAAEEQQEEPQGDSGRLRGLTLDSEYDTAPQTTARWCCWDVFDESYWKYEINLKRFQLQLG